MRSIAQVLRFGFVILLLAGGVWLGLKEGWASWSGASTVGQRIAGSGQLLYGATALASLWAVLSTAEWARVPLLAWGASLTVTATLAPVVWGGSSWWIGALSGFATIGVAFLVVRAALTHIRDRRAQVLARSGEGA